MTIHKNKPKIIVIIGPTASGKSDLAVKIARHFNGEIISADSRQIYKEMGIGTGKITKKEMAGIPHHLLNIASPKRQFSVNQYQRLANQAIKKIIAKGKLPIVCGGTGLYIRALIDNISLPTIPPQPRLRSRLEKLTAQELFKQLKKLDPRRAKSIDKNNPRRLIRALEIVITSKKPVPELKQEPQYDALYIGVKKSTPELKKAINKRVDKMLKMGLENEVQNLVKKYGWTKVLKNTIGYHEWVNFKNKKEVAEQIKSATCNFAKRQVAWIKKYPGQSRWVKNYAATKKLVGKFLLF